MTEYCVVSGAWLPALRAGGLVRTVGNHSPPTTHLVIS